MLKDVARYPLFAYRCGRCGHEFGAPVVLGGYGDLGARSVGRGHLIHVRTLEDQVFDGVAAPVQRAIRESAVSVTDRRRGEVVQAVFTVACDPDTDGTRFVIGGHPHCPSCGSPDMAAWSETGTLADLDLPGPTHHGWAALSDEDRWLMGRSATMDALSG